MSGRRIVLCLVLLLILILAGAAAAAGAPILEHARALDHWVVAHPATAALLLFLLTTLWSLFLPTMLPTVLGGFWFGLLWGSLIVYGATTAAFLLAFLAGRWWFHAGVQRWIDRRPRLARLQDAVIAEGWRTVLLMRLSPVMPFPLQNWCYGASRIGFMTCLSATLLGKLPNTVLTAALGSLARLGLSSDQAGARLAPMTIGLAIGATLLLLWSLARLARRALREDVDAVEMTMGETS